MNWTGGDLTRAAPTKAKQLQQKQKAYFARARAGLNNARLAQEVNSALPQSRPGGIIDQAEYQLLQKRQELLNRPDWLQLQVTKPLQLHFESTSDKALVGRRHRKVSQLHLSRHKTKRYRKDVLDILPVHDKKNAQAILQESSVKVKIGTDALNSGTQLTRSHLQANTASDDILNVSEEPMLLDSDEDESGSYMVELQQLKETYRQHRTSDSHMLGTAMPDLCLTPQKTTNLSSDSPVLWSTSVLEGRSEQDDSVVDHPGHDSDKSAEKQWRRFYGVGSTNVEAASTLAQKSYQETSDMALQSMRTGKVSHPQSMSAVVEFGCAVQDNIGPELSDKASMPRTPQTSSFTLNNASERTLGFNKRHHMLPPDQHVGTPVFRTPLQASAPASAGDEDLWRRFMLGSSRTDSEDSMLMSKSRQPYPEPKSTRQLHSDAISVKGTRGAPSVFAGFVQPEIPTTSRTDKTTAAIASSSSI